MAATLQQRESVTWNEGQRMLEIRARNIPQALELLHRLRGDQQQQQAATGSATSAIGRTTQKRRRMSAAGRANIRAAALRRAQVAKSGKTKTAGTS